MRENLRYVERSLSTQAQKLVADCDSRRRELNVRFRTTYPSESRADVSPPAPITLASALVGKCVHGGMTYAEQINLCGGIKTIYNAASNVELAAEHCATALFMPVSARWGVMNRPHHIAANVEICYYNDAREDFLKAIADEHLSIQWEHTEFYGRIMVMVAILPSPSGPVLERPRRY